MLAAANTNLLSIVTINLNNREGLKKTMDSVRMQQFADLQYVVIDGGSTDGSVELIKENTDLISVWVSEKDSGIYNAMNKGILKCTGDYILFLNSGDYLLEPSSLNKILDQSPVEDILYANLQTENRVLKFPEKLNFAFFFRDSIGHPAAFIKRSLFHKIGLYNETYRIVSDWEFFIKAILVHKVSYAYKDVAISFYESGGLSNQKDFHQMHQEERKQVLQPYFSELYPSLLEEMDEMKKELNRYRNSRLIGFVKKISFLLSLKWLKKKS